MLETGSSITPVDARSKNSEPGLYVFFGAFVIIVIIHLILVTMGTSPLLEGRLHGPDSYMRMVRVAQLYESGDWYDISIHRSNAPHGEELHWTRPADLVFLSGAWAISPFLGFERALYWWGSFVSPLLHLATALVLIWAAAPFMDRERRFFVVLAFVFQVGIWPQAMAARTDHHILIFLVFAAVLGLTFRLLLRRTGARGALLAGMMAGFGLWLSVEFLVVLAVIFGALVAGWFRYGGELARLNLAHAIGLSVIVALALLLERPPVAFLTEEYDRISIVHLLTGLLATTFWGFVTMLERRQPEPKRLGGRISVAIIGALCAVGVMLAVFPKFFSGPEVDYDPRLEPIFLNVISETKSLIPDSLRGVVGFLRFLGPALFGVPYFVLRIMGGAWHETRMAWILIGLGLLAYLPLSLVMLRFSPYAEILLVFVLADLLASLFKWAGRAGGLNWRTAGVMIAAPLILLGPFLLSSVLPRQVAAETLGQCKRSFLVAELGRPTGLGHTPLTVLAKFTAGPEILFHTSHSVVGTPYPRNASGQLDSYSIYSATNMEEARRLVEGRGIDLIVTCRARPTYDHLSDEPDMLDARLRKGEPPDWLTPLDLSEETEAYYRVYRVVPREN